MIGLDKRRKEHFAVYVSRDAESDVRSMVAGQRYLWLGLDVRGGIAAFDMKESSLKVFGGQDIRRRRRDQRVVGRDLDNLRVADRRLYAGMVPIDVGEGVDAGVLVSGLFFRQAADAAPDAKCSQLDFLIRNDFNCCGSNASSAVCEGLLKAAGALQPLLILRIRPRTLRLQLHRERE